MNCVLNRFIVKHSWIQIANNKISLAIHIERLTQSFWISVFIPSICLVLAAEMTLFIDEGHFEALIMVALTSNLVMYTLYSSIQDDLPADSNLKLIEVWLLHGLLMPMVVFVILVVNKLLSTKPCNDTGKISAKIKTDGSPIKAGPWMQKVTYDKGLRKKISFKQLCKVAVPMTSIIFMMAFFAVGLWFKYQTKHI